MADANQLAEALADMVAAFSCGDMNAGEASAINQARQALAAFEAQAAMSPKQTSGTSEQVAWRLKSPPGLDTSLFNPGQPDEETRKYWARNGVEIEYAYAAPVAQAEPLTDGQRTKAALWDLAVKKGLVTVHSEQLAPGTWSAQDSVASWIEGHEQACDISNEAAHSIKEHP